MQSLGATAVADIPKNRSRGQFAPTWFGDKWSGHYPGGLFEWKWALGGGGSLPDAKWGGECGTNGEATIIRSSNADFPPGLHLVHHCAHKPCKSNDLLSMLGITHAPLHLFGIGNGIDSCIGMRNVPQSRNAAEAAAVSAAVAGPSPPSPPSPPSRLRLYQPQSRNRRGGRLTAKEIAVMSKKEPKKEPAV